MLGIALISTLTHWLDRTGALMIAFIVPVQDHTNPLSPPTFLCFLSHRFSHDLFCLSLAPPLSSFYPDYLGILKCYVARLDLQRIWFDCHWKMYWINFTLQYHQYFCLFWYTAELPYFLFSSRKQWARNFCIPFLLFKVFRFYHHCEYNIQHRT